MSYQSFQQGRIFVLRWTQPTLDDVVAITKIVSEMNAKTGQKVIYFAITDSQSESPDPDTRKALLDSLSDMVDRCQSIRLILMGEGLRYTAIRTGIAGMFVLQGRRNMHMHNTFEDALRKSELTADEAQQVEQKAIEKGMINAV